MTTVPKEVMLFVAPDGGLEFIYDDEVADALKGAGPRKTCRASHVEPTPDGLWSVDVAPIIGSEEPVVIGEFETRTSALAAEVKWVLAYLAGELDA